MAALTIAAGLGKAAWAGFLMVMKLGKVVTMVITAAQWAMNAAFLASPVGLIVIGITALVAVLYAAWMGIKALWNMFADTAAGKAFIRMIEGIVDWFKSLGGIVDWVIDRLNKIPGVNIGAAEVEKTNVAVPPESALYQPEKVAAIQPIIDVESLNIDVPYRRETMTNEVPAGGITNQISKSISDNSNKTTQVAITTNQTMTPALMNEFLLMEGA